MANDTNTSNYSGFWEQSDYANKEYVCEPFSDDCLKLVEEALGYKLPNSYITLLKSQNGGFPKNTCAPSSEPTSWAPDHIAITGIFGIGKDKPWSLCGSMGSQFMIDEWGYPAIGVYICDCPSAGHDMVALDYSECGEAGEPRVVHVDQEDNFKVTILADSFHEFVTSLRHEDEYEYEESDEPQVESVWIDPEFAEQLKGSDEGL